MPKESPNKAFYLKNTPKTCKKDLYSIKFTIQLQNAKGWYVRIQIMHNLNNDMNNEPATALENENDRAGADRQGLISSAGSSPLHTNTAHSHLHSNLHTQSHVHFQANEEEPPSSLYETETRIKNVQRRMKILTALAAIGGFLFGYDTGVISGAMPAVSRSFELTDGQQEAVVSCTVLSAFISSLIGGNLNKKHGRKFTILSASFIFTLGALLMGIAWSYHSLVVGRIIIGGGIGLASLSTPIYLAEVAAPNMRGTLVTINGLLICFGQFSAGMIDGILDEIDPENGWRIMLGLAALPSIIMFVGFRSMPESPRWLVMEGRNYEALTVLKSIRESDHMANDELQDIIQVCSLMNAGATDTNAENENADEGADPNSPFDYSDHDDDDFDSDNDERREFSSSIVHNTTREEGSIGNPSDHHGVSETPKSAPSFKHQLTKMMAHPPTMRALKLGCGIMVLQQLSGINTVMYYAASIYQMSGFTGK